MKTTAQYFPEKIIMRPLVLLDGVTATVTGGTGSTIDPRIWLMGSLPITISGINGDTVKLEANNYSTNSTSPFWEVVDGGVWANDISTGLFTPFPFLRATVATHSAGTITVIIGN